jgi:hypothetical protein
MQWPHRMIIVDLDEILELANRAIKAERKIEVFGWLFPLVSFYRGRWSSRSVFHHPHGLIAFTLRTDEKEIVGITSRTFQLAAFYRK